MSVEYARRVLDNQWKYGANAYDYMREQAIKMPTLEQTVIEHKDANIRRQMNRWRVRFFKYTGTVKFFRDGDGLGVVCRWYHPIYWIMFLIAIPICAYMGEPIMECLPIRLSKWWREQVASGRKVEWL